MPVHAAPPDWRRLLAIAIPEEELNLLRAHDRTGRPLGDEAFLIGLEQNLGRILRRQKPGPKPKPNRKAKATTRAKTKTRT
jgi:putative transposase